MSSPKLPLSAIEWQIFRIMLERCPPWGASNEWVLQELEKATSVDRGLSTIQTLLYRMRDKGWLRSESVPRSILKEQMAQANRPDPWSQSSRPDRRKAAIVFFPMGSYEEALAPIVSRFLEDFNLSLDDFLAAAPAQASQR